jgi:hypothetical protein
MRRHRISKVRRTVPAEHVMVAVAVPGSVLGPISQVHVTLPSAFALDAPKPCDSLT